ncbi:membrane protein [Streptomyces hygroscopicus]|uniref:tellurite resistance/C4-dicarboxylate transporter family protein n=1 Tax=Streptomyces hygroscopicus TaxID=1912 RepID=UPI00223F5CC2|nr:tellurite resistance/C4-dicarboxylate transporter family protein [Streptomyces hygroscopicus]MCW7947325.1 membrane protein [Streptomyces hygroscopicus]
MSGTSALRTWWAQRPPATGAAVLATGILSVGLRLTGYDLLADVILALAALAWLGLAADISLRLLRERDRWLAEARSPVALTAVAATTVLGTGVSALGGLQLAEALLALAVALWAVLVLLVVRNWRRGMSGVVFLGCVATEGIAVLGAALATTVGVAWLAHTALVFFWLGLASYVAGLWCFDLRQVATGAGDQWVAGGALAISALAGAKLLDAAQSGLYLWNNDDNDVLRAVTVGLLALACLWYCVLAAAELRWPRSHYDVRRWGTVFPMGMTAVAALSVATAMGAPWLRGPGQVLLWIAVAVWCAVLVGAARPALGTVRSTAPR